MQSTEDISHENSVHFGKSILMESCHNIWVRSIEMGSRTLVHEGTRRCSKAVGLIAGTICKGCPLS